VDFLRTLLQKEYDMRRINLCPAIVGGLVIFMLTELISARMGQSTAVLKFDVASVKRTTPSLPSDIRVLAGRFEARSSPLRPLIARAHNIPLWKLVGGPDWLDSERFEIRATFPASTHPSDVNSMLRSLLEQRLRLSVEFERRTLDGDILVVAVGHARSGLHAVNVDCESNMLREGSGKGLFRDNQRIACGRSLVTTTGPGMPREVKYSALTMDDFANALSSAQRPVINRTGLDGQFDIALNYTPNGLGALSSPGISLQSEAPSRNQAIEEQLGLKLEHARVEVDLLKIRSVDLPRPEED
jgi:uncharacterized protein (TIGR03435 family)